MARKPSTTRKSHKAKPGRPSKFDEVDLGLVQKLAEYGHDDRFMASACGVHESTWHRWKEDHPQFYESLKAWKATADANVGKALYERARGYSHPEEKIFCQEGEVIRAETVKHYPPDPTSCIFWLKNRRPDMWRDKQEVEHSGGLVVKVNLVADKGAVE